MSRAGRAIRNYLTGVIATLITLVTGLVATPLLLQWLGDERLGAYRATAEWLGYVMLLDLGMSGAVSSLLAQALGKNDRQATTAILAAATQVYVGLALLMVVGVGALALAIAWLVPVGPNLVGELEAGCWASVLGFLFIPLVPWQRLADASQRGDLVNGLLVAHSLVLAGVALLLAAHGWGITGQFLAEVAGKVPLFVILAWLGLRRYPGVVSGMMHWAPLEPFRRDLWHVNWMILVLTLCGRVSFLTDNILVAKMLGPTLVVPFYLTQRLPQLAQTQLQGISNASWAALVELWVNDQAETFNRRLLELTKMIAILGVACMGAIAIFNRHFIDLWVGQDRFAGQLATAAATINGLLMALFTLWSWVFMGTGQTRRLVPVSMFGAVVNISASIVFTYYLGVVGPLLGTTLMLAVVNLCCLPLLLRWTFGTSLAELFKAVTWPLIVGIPYIAAMSWLMGAEGPSGWIGLGAAMAGVALASLGLAWLIVLNRGERKFWWERVFGPPTTMKPVHD